MTVAVVDGEPPLPPEHPSHPPICYGNLSDEEESKHSAASFILRISHHSTERHVTNNVAIFNARHFCDHDRSTANTITTTNPTPTTTTTTKVYDDDDFFAFFDLPETSDSATNAASTLVLELPPHHPTNNNYDTATTKTTNTKTTTTTDDDDDEDFFAFLNFPETFDRVAMPRAPTPDRATPPHHSNNDYFDTTANPKTTTTTDDNDDEDFFAFLNFPETSDCAATPQVPTLDRATPPHHSSNDYYDITTTTTANPATTTTTDDNDDEDFFTFLNFPDTFDCAATTQVPTPDQATPPHHPNNNHYNTATTKTTNPATTTTTDDDNTDDDEFFAFLNLPATVASEANAAKILTHDRATLPHPTIDTNEDATTTMPPKTQHDTLARNQPTLVAFIQPLRYDLQMKLASTKQPYANDINTCTHKRRHQCQRHCNLRKISANIWMPRNP